MLISALATVHGVNVRVTLIEQRVEALGVSTIHCNHGNEWMPTKKIAGFHTADASSDTCHRPLIRVALLCSSDEDDLFSQRYRP